MAQLIRYITWCLIRKNWRFIAYFFIIIELFLLIQDNSHEKDSQILFFNNLTEDIATRNSIGCEVAKKELEIWMFIEDYTHEHTGTNKLCEHSNKGIVEKNSTHLYVTHELSNRDLRCCYVIFSTEFNVYLATRIVLDPLHCEHFSKSMKLGKFEGFVKVSCFIGKESIYENVYLFIPQKNSTVKTNRHRKIIKNKNLSQNSYMPYNVIVLGIDAISRLNFKKSMPKTLSIIKAIDGIELTTYSNVGDYTSSSLAPLLTGLTHFELIENCMDFTIMQKQNSDCSPLWSKFKKFGYVTAMVESSTIKYYDHTKYYFSAPDTDYHFHVYMFEESNLNNTSLECLQEKYFFEAFLGYTKDINRIVKTKNLFAFFWEGTVNKNKENLDDAYAQFFRHLEQSDYFENTIVFFIGNHEKRQIMRSGHFETRIPFAYVMLPSSFRERYQEATNNLEANSKRLTTPLDIHKTLVYLSDIMNLDDKIVGLQNELQLSSATVSYNLFLKVPENRTCEDAMIDIYWCPCIKKKLVDTFRARMIGNILIKHLNNIVKDIAGCAHVLATKVSRVTEVVSPYRQRRKVYLVDEVHVAPYGDGIYTGELIQDQSTRRWTVRHIQRINSVRNNKCTVKEPDLAPYCSCVENKGAITE